MNYLFFDSLLVYPKNPVASPSERYPEYPFDDISSEPNLVYDSIRKMFHAMKLDSVHYGTSEWNPLGDFVHPGQDVLLKPNFVMHQNGSIHPDDLDSLVTHPSILRCVLDYCLIAMKGKGRIIVGDAPVKDCDFLLLMKRRGYDKISAFYKGQGATAIPIEFYDFRGPEEEGGQYQDLGRGVRVNLGKRSFFYDNPHDEQKYRIPNYDYRKVCKHHHGETQEYLLNSEVLKADVIINLPKPKSHRKNGYTGALKNFVGANYSKEYLPHHTEGSTERGGDEYQRSDVFNKIASFTRLWIDIQRGKIDTIRRNGNHSFLLSLHQKYQGILGRIYGKMNRADAIWMRTRHASNVEAAREGTWYGNDTLWRTVLDLNIAILYATKDGTLTDTVQRKIIHLGDMIVSGDHEGPLAPTAKEQHMLLFSDNAVEFDCIVTRIMGFDAQKLVGLHNAIDTPALWSDAYDDVFVSSNDDRCQGLLPGIDYSKVIPPFVASLGWRGYIEL